MPSPVILTILPRYASIVLRSSASWQATACAISSGCSSHFDVLPSMSVKRKVRIVESVIRSAFARAVPAAYRTGAGSRGAIPNFRHVAAQGSRSCESVRFFVAHPHHRGPATRFMHSVDSSTVTVEHWRQLAEAARAASEHAYCRYSNFRVGAAVLSSDGAIAAGCNVENASFGLTICAERNAIFSAIASGARTIVALSLYTPTLRLVTPCGACRQVLAE